MPGGFPGLAYIPVPLLLARYNNVATDRLSMTVTDNNLFGTYLKDCRARLDPTAFGFSSTRRRTPGLRREEGAQRANVSVTWYTWLEQGRGGAPSTDVLDQIARSFGTAPLLRRHRGGSGPFRGQGRRLRSHTPWRAHPGGWHGDRWHFDGG